MSRHAPKITFDENDRAELERLVRSPSTPQGLATHARVALAAAEGLTNREIAKRLHLSYMTVGKWRARFNDFGMAGLGDNGPGDRRLKYDPETEERLRALLRRSPPKGRQRWSVRSLARELGMPPSTVHDMLRKVDLRSRYLL